MFQTEAVDQVQEDRVVGSPLAHDHALLATVPDLRRAIILLPEVLSILLRSLREVTTEVLPEVLSRRVT